MPVQLSAESEVAPKCSSVLSLSLFGADILTRLPPKIPAIWTKQPSQGSLGSTGPLLLMPCPVLPLVWSGQSHATNMPMPPSPRIGQSRFVHKLWAPGCIPAHVDKGKSWIVAPSHPILQQLEESEKGASQCSVCLWHHLPWVWPKVSPCWAMKQHWKSPLSSPDFSYHASQRNTLDVKAVTAVTDPHLLCIPCLTCMISFDLNNEAILQKEALSRFDWGYPRSRSWDKIETHVADWRGDPRKYQ